MHLPRSIRVASLLLGTASLAADEQSTTLPVLWRLEQIAQVGGHSATVLGMPRVVDDDGGKAVHFNGTSDGLLLPVNPIENHARFTIEVLIKPDADGLAEQRFLHIQDEAANRALLEIRLSARGWALDTYLHAENTPHRLTLLDPAKLHPANRWTWVALVYEHGRMAHFVDGVKELEGAVQFPPMLAGQISLGVRQSKVFWFKGAIREVRFHSVALTPATLQRARP